MFDVVGVGTNSVDDVLVTSGDLLDGISSGKARIEARHVFSGGQAATTMCACVAFGLKGSYIGTFGSDENGRTARRALQQCGVATIHSNVADAPNRTAVIVIDAHGLRTVFWHRSSGLLLTEPQLNEGTLQARLVHVDDDDPVAALRAATTARAYKTPVTSDIEHANERTEELISSVTHPIFNKHLPAKLSGERDPERALRKLRRLNPGVLCMTLGEHGAAALEGDRFHVSPGFKVEAVDDTGSGDVFRAGFIYGLLRGWDVPRMLRFANAAAAVSCTRLGGIPSVPTLDEVRRLIQ